MQTVLLNRAASDEETEKFKKYTKDNISYEREPKTFIYYVKIDKYYAKFRFIADPRIFIQDPIRILFEETDVNVEIPKFKFERKYDLIETLMEMGIRDAFISGGADFSKMDGTNWLFIGQALHQSFIEVNEEGTEAAAATAIIMELTAMPDEKYFIADHPFIFLIQHEETGAILFMGRVTDPSE